MVKPVKVIVSIMYVLTVHVIVILIVGKDISVIHMITVVTIVAHQTITAIEDMIVSGMNVFTKKIM